MAVCSDSVDEEISIWTSSSIDELISLDQRQDI